MAASPLAAVKTQIQRGRTLKIHFFGEQVMESRPQIEMWQFLVENSSRWEELFLQLTSDLFPLLSGLRHRLPSLRRLCIQWYGSPSQEAVESTDCFQMAPRLVDTSIHNADRHIPFLLPAHQLTRYHLNGPWEMHRDMLKLTQNLVEARITIDFEDKPWSDPRQAIDLSRLQRLYVSHMEILNHLRVPALTTMAMYLMHSEDSIHLQSFLARSGCTLRRLCLVGAPTAHIVTHVLPQHPSITELAFRLGGQYSEHTTRDALISNLTISDPTGSTLSQQLSKIYFGCYGGAYIDYTLYLKMLQSWWKADNCALKHATLLRDSGPGPDPATVRGLDVLCQGGLDLFLGEGEEASDVMDAWILCPSWLNRG
ncbi:hypothetical protein C8R44DRAFT_984536 [Mycena epipterygia]|nr:hypothetical protein C8R44DRAFT_984536 [Mycena epipterygia]